MNVGPLYLGTLYQMVHKIDDIDEMILLKKECDGIVKNIVDRIPQLELWEENDRF